MTETAPISAAPAQTPQQPATAPSAAPGDPSFLGSRESAAAPPKPPGQPTGTSARPSWLPEKFATPEAMAQAYQQLEQRLGAGGAPAPAPAGTPSTPPSAGPTLEGAIALPAPPPAPGGDWRAAAAPFAKTWAEQGKLTDAQYAQLAQMGHDRAMVDTFFGGQAAMVQLRVRDAEQRVGGKDALKSMLAWAGTNLPPQDVQRFNAARLSPDQGEFELMVDAVNARWRKATGGNPAPGVVGAGSSAEGTKPYANVQEYYADIAKPEYDKNKSFRDECDRRAAVSPWLKAFGEVAEMRNLG